MLTLTCGLPRRRTPRWGAGPYQVWAYSRLSVLASIRWMVKSRGPCGACRALRDHSLVNTLQRWGPGPLPPPKPPARPARRCRVHITLGVGVVSDMHMVATEDTIRHSREIHGRRRAQTAVLSQPTMSLPQGRRPERILKSPGICF